MSVIKHNLRNCFSSWLPRAQYTAACTVNKTSWRWKHVTEEEIHLKVDRKQEKSRKEPEQDLPFNVQ